MTELEIHPIFLNIASNGSFFFLEYELQVSLAIRGGYVPKKIRPSNTKSDNLSLN
jgi:hypothetical protein